jgi:lysophospholipase L1-like esterase
MKLFMLLLLSPACLAYSSGGDDGPGTNWPLPGDAAPPAHHALDDLDHPALVLVVGDSIAAGYNASNNNAPGARGYARLVTDNHPEYPDWATRDIRAIDPDVQFRDLAHSGATSSDAAQAVHQAALPAVDGDVLVLVNVGGNDFNDNVTTMASAQLTAQAAATLRANLADIVATLRARYEDVAAGKRVVFAIDNIHDPTDGTGAVPAQYHDGFCATLANPQLAPLRPQAIANLATMNAAIADEVAVQRATLVDVHAAFMTHGMNGTDVWISDDCAHPTNDGHHHLRDAVWLALTSP